MTEYGPGATPTIAVLVPCYNEEASVALVVSAFRTALPYADVFVYDNNSTDRTAVCAAAAGAFVRRQPLQGKGHVVRRMFADVEADVYVMVDGDSTYDAASAPAMVDMLVLGDLDMVNARRTGADRDAYRQGHVMGNVFFSWLIGMLFGRRINDLLSGYRVFSRRFVKSFPVYSGGFQIETEMTVHALELGLPVGEIDTPYGVRPEGSFSKLNTYRDGTRILKMVATLLIQLRPLETFGLASSLCVLAALVLGVPLFLEFSRTGLVPRLPTAVLATGLMLLGGVLASTAAVLGGVARGRREAKQMAYLGHKGPGRPPARQTSVPNNVAFTSPSA